MKQKNTLESILRFVEVCNHGENCIECCWLWKGQVDTHKEYGKVSYQNEKYIAHALIFKLRNNIPLVVKFHSLHACDVSLCCNWNHVYRGDHAQNMKDKVERNRQAKGKAFPQHILNETKVRQMRRLYYSGGWIIADLVYVFGAKISVTQRILSGKDWKHVKGELLIGRL